MPDNHTAPPSEAALVLNVHGGLDTSSRLHHRFVRKEVPYPRSYERGILDLRVAVLLSTRSRGADVHTHSDILDMLLTRQMSGGSLTWHVFPPSWNVPVQGARKKVLDIGCGNGAWVIEAAKCWRGCDVVGESVSLRDCSSLCCTGHADHLDDRPRRRFSPPEPRAYLERQGSGKKGELDPGKFVSFGFTCAHTYP
jgi:hypothetical protein